MYAQGNATPKPAIYPCYEIPALGGVRVLQARCKTDIKRLTDWPTYLSNLSAWLHCTPQGQVFNKAETSPDKYRVFPLRFTGLAWKTK